MKKEVNEELKEEVLTDTIKNIEQKFGSGTLKYLVDKATWDGDVISSRSLTLDNALGIKGFPKGRIISIISFLCKYSLIFWIRFDLKIIFFCKLDLLNSNYLYFSLISSRPSVSSWIKKGVFFDNDIILQLSKIISTCPDGTSLLLDFLFFTVPFIETSVALGVEYISL